MPRKILVVQTDGQIITRDELPEDQLPPEKTEAEQKAEDRKLMVASPAQMRLALLELNLLSTVQQIADSDPQAKIVFEYATQIIRLSPFITGLQGNPIRPFTDQEVDNIFILAMSK